MDGMSMVEKLLEEQYGVNLRDVGEDQVERALADGEEPQAIVDWLAEKYDLIKIGEIRWNPSMN